MTRDRNKVKKVMTNFTIDPDLRNEFISITDKLGINRSKLVSLYIKSWVDKNRNAVVDL
jgi:hypothetical protein